MLDSKNEELLVQNAAPVPFVLPQEFSQLPGTLSVLLSPFLSESRYQKILNKANLRNRSVMPVFESTHHAHNVSAVLRTTEALGFQDVTFVYPIKMRFRIGDAIDKGASTWLCARRTNSISDCAKLLKANGYKILLVSLPDFSRTSGHYQQNRHAFSSEEFASPKFLDWVGNSPVALVFGNELHGVASDWNVFADGYAYITMNGFSESLNVSVCAAILMHNLRSSLPKKNLNEWEQRLLVDYFTTRALDNSLSLVENRQSDLLNYFDFVRSGKFFRPFD